MNGRALLIASLVGGSAMAILSVVPVVNLANCFFCLWAWAGGAFAAWYLRRSEGTVTPAEGAIAGLLSGVAGAIIFAALAALLSLVGAGVSTVINSQMGSAEEVLGSSIANLIFSGVESVFTFLIMAVLFPIFGAIAGAIYGALAGRQKTAV